MNPILVAVLVATPEFPGVIQQQLGLAQPRVVGDPLPCLERKAKPLRHLRRPSFQDLHRRLAVERIVDLDGIELLGVVREHLLRREILGVEAASPGFVVVSAGADVHPHACTSLR